MKLILILICLLLLDIICAIDADDSPAKKLLNGPDFRLTARLRVIRPQALKIDDEFFTHEYYSNRQQRARIELHEIDVLDTDESELQSIYYFDALHGRQLVRQLVKVDKASDLRCASVVQDKLTKDLFHKAPIGKSWLKKRDNVPDYVIGMARLLFVVDSLAQKVNDGTTTIRNLRAKIFKSNDPTLNGDMTIYYAEKQDRFGGFDLPIRIDFTDVDGTEIVIDYSLTMPIDVDHGLDQSQSDDVYPYDLFAFPVGLRCSEKLSSTETGWTVLPVQVVSFQFEIFKYNSLDGSRSSMSRRFVAYDSYVGSMRSDAITDSSYSANIVDLWNRKRYNLLFDASRSLPEAAGNQKQCVVSRIGRAVDYKTFLKFTNFKLMGRGRVRGLECYVFEELSDDLPVTLFPHLTYTNMDGNEETVFRRDGGSYNIIYYFATESREEKPLLRIKDGPLGPLMRVDVYRKREIVYHLDIVDYAYQLVDAPNGDRQEELFALKDRCSSGIIGADELGNLAMELFYTPQSDKPKNGAEVAKLLANPHSRNKAILRAISKASTGAGPKLSDIDSWMRVSNFGDKLTIFFQARVNVADVQPSVPRMIGFTETDGTRSAVKTPEECFEWAAHAQQNSWPVLFVTCARACHIDVNPNIQFPTIPGTTESIITSNTYKIERQKPSPQACPVLVVETNNTRPTLDKYTIAGLRLASRWLYSDLDGKVMRLTLPNEEAYTLAGNDLIFEVRKIDINNDKWSVAKGYMKANLDPKQQSESKLVGESIDGVGLTEASGHLRAPRARATRNGEEPVMSYRECRSICMASFVCRSFSVCHTTRGTECIISELDFRHEPTLGLLEEKLDANEQGKQSTKVRTISFPNPKLDQQQPSSNSSQDDADDPAMDYKQIELKVDFRCKLYKKNALDMFQTLHITRVALKESNLTPVDGQEQCAEKCLTNNLLFFKRMAEVKLELKKQSAEELDDEQLIRQIRREYDQNLLTWCSTFHYLSSSSSHLTKQAKAQLGPNALKKAGLCVLSRPEYLEPQTPITTTTTTTPMPIDSKEKKPEDSDKEDSPRIRVPFDSFSFVYSSLFESHYGVMLQPAMIDDKSKRIVAADAESCARICFLQLSGLETACKSFDFIEVRDRTAKGKFERTGISRYCNFHQLSLAEIRRLGDAAANYHELDMAGEQDDKFISYQSWHYDALESYTLDDAILAELTLHNSELNLLDEIQFYRVHAFGIVIVVIFSIAMSAAIVILHGEKLVNLCAPKRRDSITNPSRSFLSSLQAGSAPAASGETVASSVRHTRFVVNDQDLPELNSL